ncbi:MAG TPA: hypothetical protein VJR50_06885 [Mycobacterium sp.]|nr:hypothetical protein [Mycobacterium sp.]
MTATAMLWLPRSVLALLLPTPTVRPLTDTDKPPCDEDVLAVVLSADAVAAPIVSAIRGVPAVNATA